MRYGDMSFVNQPIGNFIGTLNLPSDNVIERNSDKVMTGFDNTKISSAVNSRDIKLNYLQTKVRRFNS